MLVAVPPSTMDDHASPLFFEEQVGFSNSESDGEISVTSTQPEELLEEYTVDRILGEREEDDGTMRYFGILFYTRTFVRID